MMFRNLTISISLSFVFLLAASCAQPEQAFGTSKYNASDEYLGICFIRRSPLTNELINLKLPELTPENQEEYRQALSQLSDKVGVKLFERLRQKIETFDDRELEVLRAYCDRPSKTKDDMFFQLERVVVTTLNEK